MRIHLLDADSAAKIAAGEVVERPVSVAKELIENGIDAGGTDLRIELRDGGLSVLRVTDNGQGIPADELQLAFERHATSKIASADDLGLVTTLGFRGEALPSIAAVAQVTLVSRPFEAASGRQIRIHGGQVLEAGSAGCPPGTSVSVRELFYNTPARRKFLKSPLAEGGQIARLVGHFALAYPGISFSLVSDGRPVFSSSGSGDLLDVIARLYGPEVARAMLPVELSAAAESQAEGRPGGLPARVHGYVSQPSLSRASRGYLSLFVNGRLIQGRSLLHAIEEAYASLLMTGRHPLAVLSLSLDPADIDVNVHPSKAEVKFAAERQVYSRLRQAVHQAVARHAPLPVIELRAPLLGQVPGALPALASWSGQEQDRAPAALAPGQAAGWGQGAEAPSEPTAWAAAGPAQEEPRGIASGQGQAGFPPSWTADAPRGVLQTLPMLRVLGQLALTYIIAEGPGGLYLIDQHAAHERVRLDHIERSRANDLGQAPDAQLLLQPLTLELSPLQARVAEPARPALSRLGLELEPFGQRTWLLRAIPAALGLGRARSAVLAVLDDLAAGEAEGANWDELAAHSLACHSAVRAGQALSEEEMRALIEQLERCWSPQACAHGRPTMVHLSQAQLERQFGRR